MTTLEMLDLLESGVIALRAERATLASVVNTTQQQLILLRDGLNPAENSGKPSKTVRKETKTPGTDADEEVVRRGSKRQALGRTLAQLRSSSFAVPAILHGTGNNKGTAQKTRGTKQRSSAGE